MIRKHLQKYLAAVFLVMFLIGYNTGASVVQQSGASVSPVVAPPVIGTVASCSSPCSPVGTAGILGLDLASSLDTFLSNAAYTLEIFLRSLVDDMVQSLLELINLIEMDIIDWWQTMWYEELLPDLQAMTRQLGTGMADQSRTLQSAIDASNENQTTLMKQQAELEGSRTFRPSENTCQAATVAGGYGRVTTLSRGMRNGWQDESLATGTNKKGTAGAVGAAGVIKARNQDYLDIFCSPTGNGGHNICGASTSDYYNADTQPTKYIYDKLTIDVTPAGDPTGKMAKTVEAINDNLVGVPAADPISAGALNSATGQQVFLDRRSYLARYAAVRSVPDLISGWRMPGSQMGAWVASLRKDAGIPLGEISGNPSYKEILHAMSIDRFNSGKYAVGMITDQNQIEMEKLTVDAFYLMQLRDYYELLERTALTLATQVSMTVDQTPLPDAARAAPVGP